MEREWKWWWGNESDNKKWKRSKSNDQKWIRNEKVMKNGEGTKGMKNDKRAKIGDEKWKGAKVVMKTKKSTSDGEKCKNDDENMKTEENKGNDRK